MARSTVLRSWARTRGTPSVSCMPTITRRPEARYPKKSYGSNGICCMAFNASTGSSATPHVSQFPLICPRDEPFQREDVDLLGVGEVVLQATANIEVSQLPAFTAQYEIGLRKAAFADCLGQADHFKRDLLLRRARNLLPLERNQVFLAFLLRDDIDEVLASTEALANLLLCNVGVAA